MAESCLCTGGWYCYDQRSCHTRWQRLRHLMTSRHWPETRSGMYVREICLMCLVCDNLYSTLFLAYLTVLCWLNWSYSTEQQLDRKINWICERKCSHTCTSLEGRSINMRNLSWHSQSSGSHITDFMQTVGSMSKVKWMWLKHTQFCVKFKGSVNRENLCLVSKSLGAFRLMCAAA